MKYRQFKVRSVVALVVQRGVRKESEPFFDTLSFSYTLLIFYQMARFGSPPKPGSVSCEAGGVMPLAHNICTLVVFSMPVCGLVYSFFIMEIVFCYYV